MTLEETRKFVRDNRPSWNRQGYAKHVKDRVVAFAKDSGLPVSALSEDLGLHKETLSKWLKENKKRVKKPVETEHTPAQKRVVSEDSYAVSYKNVGSARIDVTSFLGLPNALALYEEQSKNNNAPRLWAEVKVDVAVTAKLAKE